jgi:hypothetical protein
MDFQEVCTSELQRVAGGGGLVYTVGAGAASGSTGMIDPDSGVPFPIDGEALPGGRNHSGLLGYGNSTHTARGL